MPPMYINIGAYVDDDSLVDSHALVGSCAQIGKRVHLSAGAQIGGVIEPVGSLPVIVEDDVLVGGNTGIYEGAVIKARAVIAAGTILTGSTPVYDLVYERIITSTNESPLIVPSGAVVVPGARAVKRGRRGGVGTVVVHAGDREIPGFTHGYPDGAGVMDPIDIVGLARTLMDIDSTTGREQEAGTVPGGVPAGTRLPRRRTTRGRRASQRPGHAAPARGRVLDTLRLCPAVHAGFAPRRDALRARRL